MRIILFALFILIIPAVELISQQVELDKIEQLNLKLHDRDTRKIERAKKSLLAGIELVDVASGNADHQQLTKANTEIASATVTYYEVFEAYCKQFWELNRRTVAPEIERALEFERRAYGHFQQAVFLRHEAPKKLKFEEASHLYAMAVEMEMLGLLNLARAIRVYQDFPVIYAYEWEDDVEVPRESPERVARVMTFQSAENSTDAFLESSDIELKPEIVFIVQIAAHTIPIQESYLRTIYKGRQNIQMVHEDRWYKYYLGPFSTLNEARRILTAVGVKNAFIAAYEDDKRINVREAIAKLGIQ
jgi:hypothetical protein